MYPPLVEWTEARVEELKRLWVVGLSAGAIAKRMAPATRNSIIGKAHRLGLVSRKPQIDPEEQQRIKQKREQLRNASRVVRQRTERQGKKGTKMQDSPVAPRPPFIGSLEIPFADLRVFQNGAANQCRFIAAETPCPDYLACGNETLPGESWCGHCRDIVFGRGQEISDAERDRRSVNAKKFLRPGSQSTRLSPDILEDEAA
jgi:GcrA cell cycle regulator